jgi:RNA polymerase sigma-32 factor
MSYSNVPILASDNGLSRYLQEIRRFPMLEAEEEYMLAKSWAEHGDSKAAHKLVTSHLRLAAKIALGYRGYGLPTNEVISEANIGLMKAVKRFEPEKGFKLATYAMWWIRASIQEYVLRSWSLVKMGTTSAQKKKLFFNLRKLKGRIGALEDGDLRPENVSKIAHELRVSEDEVISMNRRMAGGDSSLNTKVSSEGESDVEWQDWLEDQAADHVKSFESEQELELRRSLLIEAMCDLNEREKEIISSRQLSDEPKTLEELSKIFKVSRERVRQIEVKAFEKLRTKINMLNEKKLVF